MTKLRTKGFVLGAVLVSAMFFTWACGGGGGGDGGTPPPQTMTPASMDQTTAEAATAMGMSIGDITDISGSYLDQIDVRAAGPDSQRVMPLAAWAMEKLRDGFLAGNVINEKNTSRAGSVGESGNCDNSGAYEISGSWTGPDDPADACEVSNATLTFSLSNCRDYGESANGTINIRVNGNLCAPTGISVSFSGFSMTDNSHGLTVQANSFDITMKALKFSGDDLTHGAIALNGDIAVNSLSMEFYRFNEEVTVNGSEQTVTVSGSVTGDCLDGWVTFTTLAPIKSNEYSECPYDGSVRLSGDKDMVVSFNSDGSTTIGDQTYASCTDVPDVCQ